MILPGRSARAGVFVLVVSTLILYAGCGDDGDPLSPDDGGDTIDEGPSVSFAQIQDDILTPSCVNRGCHPGGGAPMSLASGAAYDNLVGAPSAYGMDRVEPDDADNSALYLKVIGDSRAGGIMPPVGSHLSTEETEIIRAWIEAGAPEN